MNNPYRQFTVPPRLRVRFRPITLGSNSSNSNYPSLPSLRMVSPTVPYASQRLYSPLYSNTPVVAVDGTPDFNAVGQPAFTPVYMTNFPHSIPVMPVIPVDLRHQPAIVHHPTNVPDAADLLGQCVTENAPVYLQNHIPALQSQAVSARRASTVPTRPRVALVRNKVQNTANVLPGDVRAPSQQVRWIPPAVRKTGVPQTPYAVEIIPQNDETAQNQVPFGNISMIGTALANNTGYEMECGRNQSVPTVYLDVATDGSSYCYDANTQTAEDVPSVVGDITVVSVNKKRARRKQGQRGRHSGVKVLKLPVRNKETIHPGAVSLAPSIPFTPLDNTTVVDHRSRSNDNMEELYVADHQELNEPGVDNRTVPLPVQELLNNTTVVLSPSTISVESEPGELIRSDEDVGDGDDTCLPNEGVDSEKSECYEVVSRNSDALLFDMECDGDKDGETLRVILPTRSSKTAGAQTALNSKADDTQIVLKTSQLKPSSVLKTPKAKPSRKLPAKKQCSSIVEINQDDDDLDVVVVEQKQRTGIVRATRSQHVAARTHNLLQSVTLTVCENSILSVPLQSSFFRFETQSSEVFRLLSMEKSFVPHNVLTLLTDLVSSVNEATDENQCSGGTMSNGTFNNIPQGGSRKLLFQCLFCPYGELSAKRVMAHVKQQHRKYVSFMQRSLLPNCQSLVYIYCRHCSFVTYDSAALFLHFATYHGVAGILLSSPKVIESDPAWERVVDPESKARNFPFYCCPDCGYIDVERKRIAQHMLQKQSSESVFFGCVVRLIMVVRGSKTVGAYTYESLTKEENHAMFRKEIYACVCCRFFSFYPTYAFSHHIISHNCLEMLYICAASPACMKRCTTREDIVSHIQEAHAANKSLRFQCSATLLNRSTLTQLDISPGKLTAADVPVHIQYRPPSSASDGTSLEAAIEIADDDDNTDSDSDVVVLGSPHDHNTSVDVEPDSPSMEHSDVPKNTEPSSLEQGVVDQKMNESGISNTDNCITETEAEHHGEEGIEPEVVQSVENRTSTVKADGATSDTIDSHCHSGDKSATKLDHCQNSKADLNNCVERESLDSVECDSESGTGKTTEEFVRTESQTVENIITLDPSGSSHAELVDAPFDTSPSSKDMNPLAESTAVATEMVNDISVPSNGEGCTELESIQNSVPEISRVESLDCVEYSTSSNKNTNLLVDVSSSVNQVDKSCTESELIENPFAGTSHLESADSVKDLTFLNDNVHQLAEHATTINSFVSDAAGIAERLKACQADDLQGDHDRNMNEDDIRSPRLNSASTVEQELFTFDQPNNVNFFDCLVDDDSLPSFELCKSPSDRLESSERCSLNLEGDLLMMPEQLITDELQHCSEVDCATAICSVVSDTDSVVDGSCIVSRENPCLGLFRELSDDTLCANTVQDEQTFQESANSLSQEASVVKNSLQEDCTEPSLPSCAECSCEMPSGSRDSHVKAQNSSANKQCNVSDIADRPVSRFRALAGFRFPAPHSFTGKPS